jgi:hypothetical protein
MSAVPGLSYHQSHIQFGKLRARGQADCRTGSHFGIEIFILLSTIIFQPCMIITLAYEFFNWQSNYFYKVLWQ